ncbi:MAG TPA: hypothetical protein VKH82_10985 [Candidatus Binatia bacterium]|nr:hypothetical protein [Candidatus Binatia bacterium]
MKGLMKKAILALTILGLVAVAVPRPASAAVSFFVGVPGFSLYSGPPVAPVYAPPVYAPPVVYGAPVYYPRPFPFYGGPYWGARYWGGGWGHGWHGGGHGWHGGWHRHGWH